MFKTGKKESIFKLQIILDYFVIVILHKKLESIYLINF